jgi:hypothetical protein
MYFTSNNSIYDIFVNAIYIFSFYTNILYLLLFCVKAWTMFIANHQGPFQEKIRWVTDFLVHIQITTSDLEYLKCITLVFHNYVCEHIHHYSGNADDDSVSKINLLIIHHFYPILFI